MGHELTVRVSSRRLVQRQLQGQGHPGQQSGGVHDWLIQTPVSIVQPGMLVQPDADTCTLGRTLCILYAVERAANVIDLERQW